MIEYAKDTTEWLSWQHGYRYGIFLILPPPEVSEAVNALRAKYDPESARTCEAHISLSRPLQTPLTQDGLNDVVRVLHEVKPLTMQYGPLITYPPHPGVAFDISPKEEFEALRVRLHSTSPFIGSSFSRDTIPPHMTIAELGLNWEQSEELRKSLEGEVQYGQFVCNRLVYIVPNDKFVFERKLTVSFGAS